MFGIKQERSSEMRPLLQSKAAEEKETRRKNLQFRHDSLRTAENTNRFYSNTVNVTVGCIVEDLAFEAQYKLNFLPTSAFIFGMMLEQSCIEMSFTARIRTHESLDKKTFIFTLSRTPEKGCTLKVALESNPSVDISNSYVCPKHSTMNRIFEIQREISEHLQMITQ